MVLIFTNLRVYIKRTNIGHISSNITQHLISPFLQFQKVSNASKTFLRSFLSCFIIPHSLILWHENNFTIMAFVEEYKP